MGEDLGGVGSNAEVRVVSRWRGVRVVWCGKCNVLESVGDGVSGSASGGRSVFSQPPRIARGSESVDVIRVVGANDVLGDDGVVSCRVTVSRVHVLHLSICFRLVLAHGKALAEDFSPAGWLVGSIGWHS